MLSARPLISLSSFLLLCVPALCAAKTVRYDVKDAAGRNLVSFSSDAPLQANLALTHAISGWMEIDADHPESMRGEWEVDLRTFESGSDALNAQIRSTWTGVDQFPTAQVALTKVTSATREKEGSAFGIKAEAVLRARGQERPVSLVGRMALFRESDKTRQRLPGNLARLSFTSNIDLGALGVLIPDNLKMVISNLLQISADVIGTDSLPTATSPIPPPIAEPAKKEARRGRR